MFAFTISLLIAIFISTLIPFFFYKRIYLSRNKDSSENPRGIKPLSLHILFVLFFTIFFGLSFNEFYFPTHIKRPFLDDLNQESLYDIYDDILDIHQLNNQDIYFQSYRFYLDKNGSFFERGDIFLYYIIEDTTCNIQAKIYPDVDEVYIPRTCLEHATTTEEIENTIQLTEAIDLFDYIDMTDLIATLGPSEHSEEYYYEFGIDEWWSDYYDPSLFSEVKRFELFSDGSKTELTESQFDESTNYIHFTTVRWVKEGENSYTVEDVLIYYLNPQSFID